MCWTAGFLELCEYLPAALHFFLPHPAQCFQHNVSPGCRDKALLGRQVITTHFWTCSMPRQGTLGQYPGGALADAHARELDCLQGCESTADVPGMAEDHGRQSGFAPSGNCDLSHFCSPSDRLCGLWMMPSFQVWALREWEDEKRLPQSLLLALRMVLRWLLSQLEEYLRVFGFSLYPQNTCFIFFFPPSPCSDLQGCVIPVGMLVYIVMFWEKSSSSSHVK